MGPSTSSRELVTQANTKYLNLQRAGIWMKATAGQEKIIALEAKIEAFIQAQQ